MQDMKVNGAQTISGGEYGNIRINGAGECTGSLTAQMLDVNGSFKVQGALQSSTLKVDGMMRVAGNVTAEQVDVDGSLKCEGMMQTGKLDCDGMVKVGGDCKAQTMDVDGMLKIRGGKLEADIIHCDGMIDIEHGQVSADTVEADGAIKAREIVGDRIRILSRGGKLLRFFMRVSEVELIEATSVHLRGVHAKHVNGMEVHIGEKCEIDRVDCSGTLYVHPSAKVGEMTGEYTMRSL